MYQVHVWKRIFYGVCVIMSSTLLAAAPSSHRLSDLVRARIRIKHYSLRTEQACLGWIKRYIFFHDKRHPRDAGRRNVETFPGHW